MEWVSNTEDGSNKNGDALIWSAEGSKTNRFGDKLGVRLEKVPPAVAGRSDSAHARMRARYLIVDGHSAIFAWPEMEQLHSRRSSLGRDALVKKLRHYQDYTGVRVVVVFDGTGLATNEASEPHGVQIFYSGAGRTADSVIERLASKYSGRFDVVVATGDRLERETATASGAECISIESLRALLDEKAGR